MAFDQLLSKFRTGYLNTRIVFLIDLCLSVLTSFIVLSLANLVSEADYYAGSFAWFWMISSAVGSFLVFWIFRTYRIIIRHTTFRDLWRFAVSALCKVVLMAAVLLISASKAPAGHTAILLGVDYMLTLLLLLSARICMIFAFDLYKSRVRSIQSRTRILVFGTTDKSMAAISRLSNSRHYDVVGIITPNESISNNKFNDKSAYSFSCLEDVERLAKSLSLAGVLFPRSSDAKAESGRLVEYCNKLGLKTLVVPDLSEMSADQIERVALREVNIEDLLGRDEIKISLDEIKARFQGATVLVTGAAGSIGSELCRQLARFGLGKLVLFDNAETPMHNLRLELEGKYPELDFTPVIGDVRSEPRLDFVFREFKPQVVFHAAAYKHVPLMEDNPCEAVLVNVVGSRQVADKCVQYGVQKMVMVSTDKAVNPTNIMGCSKRLAEIYVQSLGASLTGGGTSFVTTRFGNVLGSNGSVIPRFREQIAAGGPVTVTHPEITRFFMTIPEACRLVLEAATLDADNRICVFDMGQSVKIDTLARRMIELSGLKPDEDIKIQYVGLRPGEKLYEEVLSNVENTDPTSHDRIRIAHVRDYSYSDACAAVDALEELSRAVKIPEMVKLMKEIVPEYISNNSRFSEYDAKH